MTFDTTQSAVMRAAYNPINIIRDERAWLFSDRQTVTTGASTYYAIVAGSTYAVMVMSNRIRVTGNVWGAQAIEGATYDFSGNILTGYNINRAAVSNPAIDADVRQGASLTGGTVLGANLIAGASNENISPGPVIPDDYAWIIPAGGELVLGLTNEGNDDADVAVSIVLLETGRE